MLVKDHWLIEKWKEEQKENVIESWNRGFLIETWMILSSKYEKVYVGHNPNISHLGTHSY
jgi:hypothetical protein